MTGISKAFPGVQALQGVDFDLKPGEIHALMGENGAGKSTLIKVLTGVLPRDEGQMTLEGQTFEPRDAAHAQSLGVQTVYQEVNLVPYLSVAENLSLSRAPMRLGCVSRAKMNAHAREALRRLELEIDVRSPVDSFSIGVQQMVAIARAIDVTARVLVLDEPTSSLDSSQTARLFNVMRKLKAEGIAILFVSHFLGQVYQVSDRITVLRNGRLVGSGTAQDLPVDKLVQLMIGRQAPQKRDRTRNLPPDAPVVLDAQDLSSPALPHKSSVNVKKGEAVGLAGLLGSGRTELARLVYGLDRRDSGQVRMAGRRVRLRGPRSAVFAGMGLCPENRKVQGLCLGLSVKENVLLSLQARKGWLRRVSPKAAREIAESFVARLAIATPSVETPAGSLSGGTQQKLILARWLAASPQLLILDEPTRGIDVGAKAEIEQIVADLCDQGMSVLFISSELEEVVRDCHRVLVLRDRAVVGELEGDALQEESVMSMISGGLV